MTLACMIYSNRGATGAGSMNKKAENQLYFKAGIAFDHLKRSVQAFESYLNATGQEADSDYYKARNFLRDGEKFYAETLKEAKRLLGPPPAYSSAVFEKWRSDFLSEHRIRVEAQELNDLREELIRNGQMEQWIGLEDIERLLAKDYEAQKSGKRKLANIKVRIILDRLQELLGQAGDLKKQAMAKLQASG
jgi:hypothetical protein